MKTRHDNLRIDGDRLWGTIGRSAEIGPGVAGGLRRLALSEADREMRDVFVEWCKAAGCGVAVDGAGNIFARREGAEDLPPVLVGSHLDTQVAGGRFDGILGVLAGLELVRTLNDHDIETRRPIEVVNWSNEEGARFPVPMSASHVFAGLNTLDWLYGISDEDGIGFGEALETIGYKGEAPVGGRDIDAYFELHIEQGPELHAAGTSVGVVVGGYASQGLNVTFRGETAHSGPTPMERRRNAFVGAAKFISAVNDIGWAFAPVGKSTATRITIWPNRVGIIPSIAEVTVDVRHRERAVTDGMVAKVRAAIETAAAEARVDAEITSEWRFGNEHFDEALNDLVRDAARRLGISATDMHSQAGHDAYNLCAIAPTALVFSPCIDGITHNEAEDVERAPTLDAVNVLMHAVLARATR